MKKARVGLGIIERVMQAAALLSEQRAFDYERRDGAEIAELDEVGGDFEIPVELGDFALEVLQAAERALQPFVRADDADVVPHQPADFIPAMVDDDELVDVLRVAARPG